MKSISIVVFAASALLLAFLPGCQQTPGIAKFNPAYLPFVAGYTSGTISVESAIEIELTSTIATPEQIGEVVSAQLFAFSPALKGKATYSSPNSIRFQPELPMPGNTLFEARFALGKVIEVPDSLQTFTFNFKTIQQHIEVTISALISKGQVADKEKTLEGTVYTSDVVDGEVLADLFTATLAGESVAIMWTHEGDRKTHHFTLPNLKRQQQDQAIVLQWNGSAIGAQDGEHVINLPGTASFKVTAVRTRQEPEQKITIEFSDPIDRQQSLLGLIQVEGQSVQLDREANLVHIYPQGRLVGTYTLTVNGAVRDINGENLAKPYAEAITFEEIKPAVRLVGSGVILPQSEGLVFPFEAVNLRAVDVTVVKIYAHNVLQFLQNNALDEQDELRRVGRMVATHTVPLEPVNPNHLHQWMRYGLELEDIIRTEPGAIYHIGLSFRPSYSVFGCGSDAALEDPEDPMPYMDGDWDKYSPYEYSNWYYYESYFGDDFTWADQDNPCKKAYYNRDRFIGRNVLASNLGIIAKKGNDGSVVVSVTDLTTTKAVAGAAVTLYNFQQHPIAQLQTDSKGQATTVVKENPFVLVAEKAGQKGYLKMQDGVSLSVSRLDVGGVTPADGLKGFLYAERGVWRPGDSIYLQLMLEDEAGNFPAHYPVELTVTDPRGQVAQKTIHTPAAPMHYDLRFATQSSAPTGNWTALVKVGGASFSKRIKVETIKPNRLKVLLETHTEVLRDPGEPIAATLISEWLHGASAAGLAFDVEAQLTPQTSLDFPKYKAYHFVDPANDFYASAEMVAEGFLDAKGQAALMLDLAPSRIAPGRLHAALKTRVYEPSGDFSVDRVIVPYDPFKVYVGIQTPAGDIARGMLLTDTLHTIRLVTLNPKGEPVPDRRLQVELYQLNFSWWWNQEDRDQLASYISRRYVSPVQTAEVTTNANGEATWGLQVNFPTWGNYLIRVKDEIGGHATGKTVFLDWPGWAGRGQREQPGGAALLNLTADQEKYAVGDEMRLTLPTSTGGRAWISLENGQKVIQQFWVDTDEEQTVVAIPATAAMAPNVYAFVTLIQPHGQTENDVPIRLYGAIPLLVEDPSTHLEPLITTSATWRPETTASVKVSEANGRPMHYTLAVVDEGLLGLTRFGTPDPWAHFYAREALGVRTFDMYDHVLGAFGGTLEQLLSIGGDAEAGETAANKRANRFTPMVRFLGPFILEKGQTASHDVDVPSYVGAVRVMVVSGQDHSFGHAEQEVKVKKPLMVLATAPRVISPTEIIEVPVSVFAMEDKVKNVKVTLTVTDNLEVVGASTKQVTFSQPGDQLVPFEVRVRETMGMGQIVVSAVSGTEAATHTIDLPIRNPNPVITREVYTEVAAGESAEGILSPVGISGTNSGLLEVSLLPPLNLSGRLNYLIRYPHGCVEQTISRSFPQLFVKDLMDLSPEQQEQLDNHIKVAIGKLKSFQQPNGGLSYWPGMQSIDDWSTTYAGHFMLLAKEKGYVLPYDFLAKWIEYQRRLATQWQPSHLEGHYGYSAQMIQAYRLYTLALAGEPEMGAMNLLREQKDLSNVAAWRLAAAYARADQREAALEMTAMLSMKVLTQRDYTTYGSSLRDKAIVLECMAVLGLQDRAASLSREISLALFADTWYSTQTTAYSLLALSQYALPKAASQSTFTYVLDNTSITATADALIWQRPFAVATSEIKWRFDNTTDKDLHVTTYLMGQPPLGEMEPEQENIQLTVSYQNRNGEKVDPGFVAQGTDLMAAVTVTHAGPDNRYTNLALTHIVPSGWEIATSRLDGFNPSGRTATFDYQDIRDDRLLTYFDLSPGETKTFRYVLNATYKGTFYMPGVQVEAMYDRDVRARLAGQWVQVADPEEESADVK